MDFQTSSPGGDWNSGWGKMGSMVPGLVSTFHPAVTGATKYSNSAMRSRARSAVRGAIRARDQYEDKALRDRQYLSQSLYGRGLGNSSIAQEDQAYFERAHERALADYKDQIADAKRQQRAVEYGIRAQRVNTYMGYLNQFLGLAGGIAGVL